MRDLTVTGVQTCALPISFPWKGCFLPGTDLLTRTGWCPVQDVKEIGRASWRERGEISVVAVLLKKKRRYARFDCDWSSDVCSSDLLPLEGLFSSGNGSSHSHRMVPGSRRERDRKSVVEGKRGDLGGRRIIKKKKAVCEI